MNGQPLYGHFIGTGWAFPPAFTAGGADVALARDEQDIFESLQILLATSTGERVMREDYGCNLRDYLFEELDQRLLNNLRLAVADSIRLHETRIETEDIRFDVQADFQQSVIYIRIGFRVRSTNSRYNMVYPFYLTESTLGPAGGAHVLPAPKTASIPPISTQITVPTDEVLPPEYGPFISYRHQANVINTDNRAGNYTRLDHPRLNGNPDAILFVNAIWAYDPADPNTGTSNPNSLEVDYRDGYWYICNRNPEKNMSDGDPNEYGHAFNVLIAPQGIPNAFLYTGSATDTGTNMNRMYIDNNVCNGNPDAYLMVTPRSSVVSVHEIGVGYEPNREQWFIYNQVIPEESASPDHFFAPGSAFNILALLQPQLGNMEAFGHRATKENKRHLGTFFTHPDLDGKKNALLFITQAWRPDLGGVYNDSPMIIWYDAPGEDDDYDWEDGHWFVYNTKGSTPPDAVFNVFVLKDI